MSLYESSGFGKSKEDSYRREIPKPKEDDVLVRIRSVGVCG